MPEISQRAELMPASPIRKLVPLAEAARARGTKIYHLNIGQPDLPSPQTGLDALKKIDRTVLEYSPSDGYRSLREKLVGYYEQFQIKLSPDDIIVTTGGSEAVLFAFMSCLNPGDEIIVPEPAYANYMAFAISAGAVIRPVVSSIEQGFALPDVAEFEKLINDRTRGILICNPNNPTGLFVEPDWGLAFLAKCRERGITVVLITHHMNEAMEADRAIVMNRGQVAMDGTPRAVFARVEELRALGLAAPDTVELLYELRSRGIDIPLDAMTVEECADAICHAFSGEK